MNFKKFVQNLEIMFSSMIWSFKEHLVLEATDCLYKGVHMINVRNLITDLGIVVNIFMQ